MKCPKLLIVLDAVKEVTKYFKLTVSTVFIQRLCPCPGVMRFLQKNWYQRGHTPPVKSNSYNIGFDRRGYNGYCEENVGHAKLSK